MKKLLIMLCIALMLFVICVLPVIAETAQPTGDATEAVEIVADDPEPAPVPGEPLTWAYLATIAGAAAATLLVVQYAKVRLDKVWKIPTRVFVYLVALVFMLLGTAFTTGLTVNTALLTAVNAVVAAVTAYGAYEVTFAKKDAAKKAAA